jgi:carbon dioxide concentrating mechanism protein CcmN
MQLPTLPLISNSHVYVEGDVSIDPSAAIAAGVILRAAFDSKIIIAAGVCIGMGSILHSHQGTLEVEAGANLGAGVLVVGKGKIGANACIGAATTIWNSSIQSGQVVQAGSVVGDRGRQITDVSSTSTSTTSSDAPDPSVASTSTTSKESLNGQVAPTIAAEPTGKTNEDSPTEVKVEEPNLETGTSVYGQGNLNRLLKTLFPYTTPSLNPPPEDG